jgi:hypothetical protein
MNILCKLMYNIKYNTFIGSRQQKYPILDDADVSHIRDSRTRHVGVVYYWDLKGRAADWNRVARGSRQVS